MNNISELHKPVMLDRCIELLGDALQSDKAVLVDGTLGLAGHSEAFLQRFPKLTLVGIDRDANALKLAKERLSQYSNRIHLVQGIYSEIPEVLEDLGIKLVDAVLLDLGVSSMQLDKTERGFSYSQNAPLDMRMDNTDGITAADVINQYSEKDLARIFKTFGEERFAKPIAKKIVQLRTENPFVSSKQLTEVIGKVIPFIPGKKPF